MDIDEKNILYLRPYFVQ